MNFEHLIDFLKSSGFFTVLLPLILIFTIVFSILDNLDLFKNKAKDTKNLNIIIALAFSLIFTISARFIFVIENLFPKIALLILVFLCLKIILTFVSFDYEKLFSNKYFMWFYVFLIFIIGILSFKFYEYLYMDLNFQIRTDFIIFLVFVFLIYYITKTSKSDNLKESKSKFGSNSNSDLDFKDNKINNNKDYKDIDSNNSNNSKNSKNLEQQKNMTEEEKLENMSSDEFEQKKMTLSKEELEEHAKKLKPGEKKEFNF